MKSGAIFGRNVLSRYFWRMQIRANFIIERSIWVEVWRRVSSILCSAFLITLVPIIYALKSFLFVIILFHTVLLLVFPNDHRVSDHLLLRELFEVFVLALHLDVVSLNRYGTVFVYTYVPIGTRRDAGGFDGDGGENTVVYAASLW